MTSLQAEWPDRRGQDTLLGRQGSRTKRSQEDKDLIRLPKEAREMVRVMAELGAWKIGPLAPVNFYSNFRLLTHQGAGQWEIDRSSPPKVSFTLGKKNFDLQFDEDPLVCLREPGGSESWQKLEKMCKSALKFTAHERKLDPRSPFPANAKFEGEIFGDLAGWWGDVRHANAPIVFQLAGSGPWAWQGTTPLAFLRGGMLLTPWGNGKWGPLQQDDNDKTLFMDFVGSQHIVTLGDCNSFTSKRKTDGNEVKGWMQIPIPCPIGVL